MCTELNTSKNFNQYDFAIDCIHSVHSMLGRVAARCGKDILLGCKTTTEYLQESLTVLSIKYPLTNHQPSVYDIPSTKENAEKYRPVILSHPKGANSNNSPIKKNESKNDHKQKTIHTSNTSRPNGK
jgi:hypothetical protein